MYQLKSTQPPAPLISSVNAVEITSREVKHVSQWGIKRFNGRRRDGREKNLKTYPKYQLASANINSLNVNMILIINFEGTASSSARVHVTNTLFLLYVEWICPNI